MKANRFSIIVKVCAVLINVEVLRGCCLAVSQVVVNKQVRAVEVGLAEVLWKMA